MADSAEPEVGSPAKIGVAQITLFGVGIVISGHYLNWSVGLEAGYYGFLSGTLFIATGFIALMLCLAEITSAVPFTGGLYGCVRLTLGPYLGFLVGFFEVLQNVFYNACIVGPLGHVLALAFKLDEMYEPLLWLLFFAVAIPINLLGGQWFWYINSFVSSLAIVIILIYLIATSPTTDFEKYAGATSEDNFRDILAHFPYASWFFVGLEMIPLCCGDAKEAKKSVPKAILISTGVLILFALALITCVSSNQPGLLSMVSEDYPLIPGLMHALNLNRRSASALMIPALFASANAFIFLFGRQMKSLAASNLFPPILETCIGKNQTPVVAILFGSLLSYLLLLLAYFVEQDLYLILLGISAFGSAFVYLSIFYTYIAFQKKFATIDRYFKNPLGIPASYYGMIVVMLGIASFLVLEKDGYIVLAIFAGIMFLASLMYIFYARKRQRFSKEEQKVFFNAYVINANRGKAKAIKRKSMYMSGVTQDSTSFRSYRKGSMSARRMSGDRSDGSESAKSFRSEDLLISKKLSIDEQDVSSGGLDFSQSNKSLHNSSGHSLHIPSEDGELAGASNMLFTINEEDRTRSNLSLGRDSSVMTLDPGMLTARSERSHLPLMVQTDLADEESGNRFEGNEGWEQVANSESQVLKKWKQSMNVVSAAQGFLTSGTLRRSRLDLIDEGHESHEGAQSDSNITQHIEHHEQIAAAVTAVTAVTHKPLASPSNFDHRPAPKLASLVQRIKEQNEGSDSVSKSKSKLLKKVGGSIITSMRVLSTLNKVVTDDPLFAQYTESFVNSALEERYNDFQARNSPSKPEDYLNNDKMDIKKKVKPVVTPKPEPNNANTVIAPSSSSPSKQFSFGSKGLKSLVSQVMKQNVPDPACLPTATNLVYPVDLKSSSEATEDCTANLSALSPGAALLSDTLPSMTSASLSIDPDHESHPDYTSSSASKPHHGDDNYPPV